MSKEPCAAFASRFGELEDHPLAKSVDDEPGIIRVHHAFTNFHTAANVRYGLDLLPGAPNLLTYLISRVAIPEYQVRWRWRPNSVAIWDNRCTQHYAVVDYPPCSRKMQPRDHRGRAAGMTGSEVAGVTVDHHYADLGDVTLHLRDRRERGADRDASRLATNLVHVARSDRTASRPVPARRRVLIWAGSRSASIEPRPEPRCQAGVEATCWWTSVGVTTMRRDDTLLVCVASKHVATLRRTRGGLALDYEPTVIATHGRGAVCLSMSLPVTNKRIEGPRVEWWAEGLLP